MSVWFTYSVFRFGCIYTCNVTDSCLLFTIQELFTFLKSRNTVLQAVNPKNINKNFDRWYKNSSRIPNNFCVAQQLKYFLLYTIYLKIKRLPYILVLKCVSVETKTFILSFLEVECPLFQIYLFSWS